MRDKLELTGMVLSSSPVGDYDKRLVILTRERGKITAFARGARKPNSPFLGNSEPFNFGTFFVIEGFDAYRLTGAEVKEYFLEVKQDIESVFYGTYFCDVLEYFCVEGIGDVNMLNLLYMTLKALSRKEVPNPLIRRIFELKALAFDGEAMTAFFCAGCGKKELEAFYPAKNGLLCEDCIKKAGKVLRLSQTTVYTLQYVISEELGRIYSFRLSEEAWREFDEVVGLYFSSHVQKKFKSLEILASLS